MNTPILRRRPPAGPARPLFHLSRTLSRLLLPLCALSLLTACGAAPDTLDRRSADDLRARADRADREIDRGRASPPPARRPAEMPGPPPPPKKAEPAFEEETVLPPPPGDSLWGDAYGATQHEAVRNAQRVVSEQISARLESETRSFEAEYGDGRGESEASIRIKTTSEFDHAELIETVGVIRSEGGFTARAALDKRKAAAVYAEELAADRRTLETLAPTIDRAIAENDAAVLLQTRFSPAHIIADMRRKAGILRILDRPVDVRPDAQTLALVKRAVAARADLVVRLSVDGGGSEALRRAVVGEIGRLLQARGCGFVEWDPTMPPADAAVAGPAVDASIQVSSRDHQEHGMLWRYLGFQLRMVDARTGKPVFHYSGMPEIAHGGGPNWAMADQAVARRLGQILDRKAAPDFGQITCR